MCGDLIKVCIVLMITRINVRPYEMWPKCKWHVPFDARGGKRGGVRGVAPLFFICFLYGCAAQLPFPQSCHLRPSPCTETSMRYTVTDSLVGANTRSLSIPHFYCSYVVFVFILLNNFFFFLLHTNCRKSDWHATESQPRNNSQEPFSMSFNLQCCNVKPVKDEGEQRWYIVVDDYPDGTRPEQRTQKDLNFL